MFYYSEIILILVIEISSRVVETMQKSNLGNIVMKYYIPVLFGSTTILKIPDLKFFVWTS